MFSANTTTTLDFHMLRNLIGFFHDFATLRTMSKLSVGEGITFGCSLDWLAQVFGDCILIMFLASKWQNFEKNLNFPSLLHLLTLDMTYFRLSLAIMSIDVFDISLDWKCCEWNWCPMVNLDCLEYLFMSLGELAIYCEVYLSLIIHFWVKSTWLPFSRTCLHSWSKLVAYSVM